MTHLSPDGDLTWITYEESQCLLRSHLSTISTSKPCNILINPVQSQPLIFETDIGQTLSHDGVAIQKSERPQSVRN